MNTTFEEENGSFGSDLQQMLAENDIDYLY
jgi:hypothetical protein